MLFTQTGQGERQDNTSYTGQAEMLLLRSLEFKRRKYKLYFLLLLGGYLNAW